MKMSDKAKSLVVITYIDNVESGCYTLVKAIDTPVYCPRLLEEYIDKAVNKCIKEYLEKENKTVGLDKYLS